MGPHSVGVCTTAPSWALRTIYEAWPEAALQLNIKGKNPLELVLAGALHEARRLQKAFGSAIYRLERAAFVGEMRRCHSEAADAKAQREKREQEFVAASAAADVAAAALMQEELAATSPAVLTSRQSANQRATRKKKSTNKPTSTAL